MMSQFADMTSLSIFWRCRIFIVNFSNWSKSHVSIITISGVMTISDWPEVRKSKILAYTFCSVSGYLGKLGIPSLAQMSIIKCYWMLDNARITAFTISELLMENQTGEGKVSLTPTQIRVNTNNKLWNFCILHLLMFWFLSYWF